MLLVFNVFLLMICTTLSSSHQDYPGTITRPVLSDDEAAEYTKEKYLDGWTPETIKTTRVDYLVGGLKYKYIQEAVNAAIYNGGTDRKYIRVLKGTYKQAIFIPKTTVPITIYGTPMKPEEVHIYINQSAKTDPITWQKNVNPDGNVFKKGDPAWDMYTSCLKNSQIGFCSSLIWVQADNAEIGHMTFDNPSVYGQALAARASGDKQNWFKVNIYGFQDTLYLEGKNRIYFNSATIKGDVDFIYGNATAVFENSQIIARADRRNSAIVFAPNTDNKQKYGFLITKSKITAEKAIRDKHGCHMARSWDTINGEEKANGQIVIRETEIDDVIKVDAPYNHATGGRPYAGNNNKKRNLDDPNYNRFWEYKNTGSGA